MAALAETVTEPASDATATKVDDVARAALDRGPKGRDKKRSEPTEATREFWETWADNKSTKPEAPAPVKTEAPATEEISDNEETHDEPKGRSRGARGGRGRGKKDDAKREAKPAKKHDDDDKPAATPSRSEAPAGRGKRDTVVTPAPEGGQARLFVSLGKKHGVSADDLRTLLASPIGGDTARIGSVSLRDSHAHVRVPEELVDAIIAGVHGKQHNDHDVTVERSRA
ncbi:MAG TPA: DbpA RNA binding domain-containing protein [Kofleriaceae bacterium]|nr:DbpA RNA binding domain-containing protein [Kofleriaceae bacterium]